MTRDEEDVTDTTWWNDHLPRVHEFVRRRLRPELRNLEGATEMVQSACGDLLEELRHGRSKPRARHRWGLLRVALRKIVQKHRYHAARKRDRRRLLPDFAPDGLPGSNTGPLGAMIAAERARALATAMQRLPEHYQRIIEWVHFEKLPHVETAARLGRTEDASKMLLSRAMARLAAELAFLAPKG
ncbi:MAG: sigma-70 family RNA polymerase sigma factor [Planctomycetes bacterium]|nr:sigma-70 family RNA polymerase sigma factor [Planctomycetota bacterium]